MYLTYPKPTWYITNFVMMAFRHIKRCGGVENPKVGFLEAVGKSGLYWIPNGVNLGRVLCRGVIAQSLIWM